jgi:transposase InsO family protein
MKELNIEGVIRRKKRLYKRGSASHIAPNLISRNFKVAGSNRKWGTDVTEILIGGEKAYLSVIVDFYNGEIVSYDISRRDNFFQIKRMLMCAFAKIPNNLNLILHSDQGRQYRLRAYHSLLKEKGIKQSMSRKGNCLDNGVVENFFGHMKCELLYFRKFDNIDHFIDELHSYIYYYNNYRIKTRRA